MNRPMNRRDAVRSIAGGLAGLFGIPMTLPGVASPPLPLPGPGTIGVANVRDFGATGNGVTDDRAPIQAAIDWAQVGGEAVYLPPGTYAVGGEIRTNRNTRLFSESMRARITALPAFQFTGPETAIIHQYRDALPVMYATPGPTERLFLDRITIDGLNRPGANGILCSMQQPARWDTVRVENCPGYGIAICDTVQAVFTNLMMLRCGIGLVMRSASLCYFHGLNIEQSYDRHMLLEVLPGGGMSKWCHFIGVHFEATLGGAHIYVDVKAGRSLTFENVYASIGAAPCTVFNFESVGGTPERAPVYTIISAEVAGSVTNATFLRDVDRGLTLSAFDDLRNFIPFMVAGNENYVTPQFPGKNDVTAVRRGSQVVRL